METCGLIPGKLDDCVVSAGKAVLVGKFLFNGILLRIGIRIHDESDVVTGMERRFPDGGDTEGQHGNAEIGAA